MKNSRSICFLLEQTKIAHNGSMEAQRQNSFRKTVQRGRMAYRTFAEHRATTIAGTLVFFLIMSLVPFLFWLTLLFGEMHTVLDKLLELELFGWRAICCFSCGTMPKEQRRGQVSFSLPQRCGRVRHFSIISAGAERSFTPNSVPERVGGCVWPRSA